MPASVEALIDRQLRRWEHERQLARARNAGTPARPAFQPLITVSRQHGSRGREIAAGVADRFHYTLLHRNLIDRISESTGFTRRLVEALDEHARSQLQSWIESMMWGRYLDESDYAVGLLKTVRSIAALGGAVVVGRGANLVVGLEHGVHVRIIAPREERIRNLAHRKTLTAAEAAREVRRVDAERAKFVRKPFGRSVDDPLAYDLVVNESGCPLEALVDSVTVVARQKMDRLRAGQAAAAA